MTWSRARPYPARLALVRPLHGEGSTRGTRHVELDLGDSGIVYQPGDAVGVLVPNLWRTADELIRAMGLDREAPVTVGKETLALAQALEQRLFLGRASVRFVRAVRARLSGTAADELDGILGDEDRREAYLATRDYVDVLREHPDVRLEAQELAAAMNPIAPRLYSIASSQRVHPGSVHLTVGVVAFDAHGRHRHGHVSGWLVEEARAGETTVPMYLQPTKHFRLPEDPAADVIMIGPGTGIAPFRAFLQERRARGDRGRNWLFFGHQHERWDYLYRDDLAEMLAGGVLTRVDCAFSRDGAAKVYVQHRMREASAELWGWIQGGAYVYVCGDAHRMAKDVHHALVDIAEREGPMSRAAAEELVGEVLGREQRRYLRDVY